MLALWMTAQEMGFRSRYWMTFKQAQALKGFVKKGQKATGIIYADKVTKEQEGENGEPEKSYAFLKAYAVFSADQIEGLPEKFYAAEAVEIIEQPEGEAVEIPGKAWLANIPAVIRHGGDRAYFSPSQDFIAMPMAEQFRDGLAYTTTLIHELGHWTGHSSRLDRKRAQKWGDDHYAQEELIAELCAAFGAAQLGMAPAIREDHAPYIAGWIRQLKNDPRELLKAAAQASKALDHLNSYQPEIELQEAA